MSLFVFFAVIDLIVVRHVFRTKLFGQWILNIGLHFSGQIVQLVVPVSTIVTAAFGTTFGIGLLPLLNLDGPISGLVVWGLASSLISYLLHVAAHKFHLLWAFHRIHHCDELLNASTGVRHHPIETLYNVILYSTFALMLAPPPEAILIWFALSTAMEFFTHSQMVLPKRLNSVLECIIFTPALHRVHHSADPVETDSNYGGVFTFWDRLFGTFIRAEPRRIGLDSFTLSGGMSRDFDVLLVEPFRFVRTK